MNKKQRKEWQIRWADRLLAAHRPIEFVGNTLAITMAEMKRHGLLIEVKFPDPLHPDTFITMWRSKYFRSAPQSI